jgi:hypothetical protein
LGRAVKFAADNTKEIQSLLSGDAAMALFSVTVNKTTFLRSRARGQAGGDKRNPTGIAACGVMAGLHRILARRWRRSPQAYPGFWETVCADQRGCDTLTAQSFVRRNKGHYAAAGHRRVNFSTNEAALQQAFQPYQ